MEEKFFKKRSTEVCRAITGKYDLHWGSEKALSQLEDIHKPEDQILYQTARVVTEELYYSSNMSEFRMNLMSRGIQIREIRHGSREGILFVVNGTNGNQYTFAGSRLGRHLTCQKVKAVFKQKECVRLSPPRERYIPVNVIVSRLAALLAPPATPQQPGSQPHHPTAEELKEERNNGKAGRINYSFQQYIG